PLVAAPAGPVSPSDGVAGAAWRTGVPGRGVCWNRLPGIATFRFRFARGIRRLIDMTIVRITTLDPSRIRAMRPSMRRSVRKLALDGAKKNSVSTVARKIAMLTGINPRHASVRIWSKRKRGRLQRTQMNTKRTKIVLAMNITDRRMQIARLSVNDGL